MASGDRIELRGLRLLGRHGALPGEQDRHQPFEVDIDVDVDLGAAGLSDDLADTLDYAALVDLARAVVETESWSLLERVAERIAADVVAADGRVRSVAVGVRKLRPPVPEDLATAGVRVVRPGRRGLRRAFLGLGSNQGDRARFLADAVAAVPDMVAVSPVYETEPVGGPEGQPAFLNLVVELSTRGGARDLLVLARRLEAAAGRERAERWGPRPLDVDVLWVEGETVDDPDLAVPHPRMTQRRFVMAPLADLAPEVVPPDWEQTATGTVRVVGPLVGLAGPAGPAGPDCPD